MRDKGRRLPRDKGRRLPEDTHCIPNFTGTPVVALPPPSAGGTEFFFGCLEERKGARVFCEALTQLPPEVYTRLRVAFLGKEAGYRVEDVRTLLRGPIEAGLAVFFGGLRLTGSIEPFAHRPQTGRHAFPAGELSLCGK